MSHPCLYQYINMIVVGPSVTLSVCPLWEVSGNDLTSRHKAPYLWLLTKRRYNLCDCQSRHQLQAQTPAPWTDHTKTRQQWTFTRTSQLNSQIQGEVLTKSLSQRYIVDSVSLLTFTTLARETASKLTSFWAVDYVLKQDVVNAHAQASHLWNASPCVCCLHN